MDLQLRITCVACKCNYSLRVKNIFIILMHGKCLHITMYYITLHLFTFIFLYQVKAFKIFKYFSLVAIAIVKTSLSHVTLTFILAIKRITEFLKIV